MLSYYECLNNTTQPITALNTYTSVASNPSVETFFVISIYTTDEVVKLWKADVNFEISLMAEMSGRKLLSES